MNEPVTSRFRATAPSNLRARINEIFTPSSPVTRRDLFAGRSTALPQLIDMIHEPGRHPVIFGERGTGKTSLATIVPEFTADPIGFVRVVADQADTFDSLWRKVADGVRTVLRRAERGLATSTFPADTPTTLARAESVSHDDVLALLARLSAGAPTWIVFDDFDCVEDADSRRRMRELADATLPLAPRVTLVFAGSATAADRLIEPSLSLVPVQVSRMTPDESLELVLRALRKIGIVAEDVVVERIAILANGLPQVTQALACAATHAANDDGCEQISNVHLDRAVKSVIGDAPASVREAYEQATVRARRGIYPEILLACALSPRDAYGTFSVADVCATVTRIVRREVRGLTNQVSALTEEGRGSVLDKQGAAKLARYRFVDPSLEPYILMRGLEEGWTTHRTPSWLPGLPETMELSKVA